MNACFKKGYLSILCNLNINYKTKKLQLLKRFLNKMKQSTLMPSILNLRLFIFPWVYISLSVR